MAMVLIMVLIIFWSGVIISTHCGSKLITEQEAGLLIMFYGQLQA